MKRRLAAIILCILIMLSMVASVKAAESLTIYVDDGNADYLAEQITAGEKDADSLIALLVKYKMVPEGTKVNSYEKMNKDHKVTGKIDLSKAYKEAVTHTGTAGETMYIYSVVNTLIQNLDLDQVELTADGSVIETGHAVYDEALTFYDHIIPAADWSGNTVTTQSMSGDGTMSAGQGKVTDADPETVKPSNATPNKADIKEGTETDYAGSVQSAISPEKIDPAGQFCLPVKEKEPDTSAEKEKKLEVNSTEDGKNQTIIDSMSTSLNQVSNHTSRIVIVLILGGSILCLFLVRFLSVLKKKKI